MNICIYVCITSNKYICIFVYRYQLDPHKLSQHFCGSNPKFFPFFCTDQFPLLNAYCKPPYLMIIDWVKPPFNHSIEPNSWWENPPFRAGENPPCHVWLSYCRIHEAPWNPRYFPDIHLQLNPMKSHYNPIKSHTYHINISYISIKSHFHIPLKSH